MNKSIIFFYTLKNGMCSFENLCMHLSETPPAHYPLFLRSTPHPQTLSTSQEPQF